MVKGIGEMALEIELQMHDKINMNLEQTITMKW